MPDPVPDPAFVTPATLEEALAALARPGAVVVAGGTWVMRAPLRREGRADVMVSLAGLPGLAAVLGSHGRDRGDGHASGPRRPA
jgi:CO/xanthine dehydrogenase FAD-binding subunit